MSAINHNVINLSGHHQKKSISVSSNSSLKTVCVSVLFGKVCGPLKLLSNHTESRGFLTHMTFIYKTQTTHTELTHRCQGDSLWLQWFPLDIDKIRNGYSFIFISQPCSCTLIYLPMRVLADI